MRLGGCASGGSVSDSISGLGGYRGMSKTRKGLSIPSSIYIGKVDTILSFSMYQQCLKRQCTDGGGRLLEQWPLPKLGK